MNRREAAAELAELDEALAAVGQALDAVRAGAAAGAQTDPPVQRWRADAAAAAFHFRRWRSTDDGALILVVLGGTGTGKSTLINRVIGADVSAASFRRTYTAGPIAVARQAANIPDAWLGLPQLTAAPAQWPARGCADALTVVEADRLATAHTVWVDTPDLDGDQPAHWAQADRAFRWAQAVVFVVTPEKYQMTELWPYYRLAQRYAVAALCVMNKCESEAVVEDYRAQLAHRAGWSDAPMFVVPRDDAAYEPAPQASLAELVGAVDTLNVSNPRPRQTGLANRAADLADRLADQVVAPWQDQRRVADELIDALRAMGAAAPGIDVNPVTQQLQRRLQQRSILYLIGPQRVLDRVRQVPGLLARLPRSAWDVLIRGQRVSLPGEPHDTLSGADAQQLPDFPAMLADQLGILQTRIDDVLRSSALAQQWVTNHEQSYRAARIDPAQARCIAEEELADLRQWLQKRWNATPRDTAVLLKLLRHLPGGQRLTQWSESAPYLLAVIVATHHAFFGHIDLMILGGWGLATWLTERLSNEVAARTRQANRRIAERFTELAQRQIEQAVAWVDARVPARDELDRIQRAGQRLAEVAAKAAVSASSPVAPT